MNKIKEEKTFVMIKPDGTRKGLIGEIISRFEQRGLKIVFIEMIQPTNEQIDNHYPKDETWITRLGNKTLSTYEKYGLDPIADFGTDKPEDIGPEIRKWIINYMTSAPLVLMVVQGIHAVDVVRKISGETLPYKADMGTIRGDFSIDSPALANAEHRAVENILHASETAEEAKHEIEHWLGDKSTYTYKRYGVD